MSGRLVAVCFAAGMLYVLLAAGAFLLGRGTAPGPPAPEPPRYQAVSDAAVRLGQSLQDAGLYTATPLVNRVSPWPSGATDIYYTILFPGAPAATLWKIRVTAGGDVRPPVAISAGAASFAGGDPGDRQPR